jgi:hypothetical protein
MAVFSQELLSSVDPTAELLVRNDLVSALVSVIDASFADPANSGTADIEPASVANGAPSIPSSGDGIEDIQSLVANFSGDPERAVLIGSPRTFTKLHDPLLMPGLGPRGGTALGIPAIPSAAAGDALILLDPDAVALGEGETDVRTSGQASIEVLDNPTNDTAAPTATSQVALWQVNAAAILVEQRVNWQAIRPCASVVTGVGAS